MKDSTYGTLEAGTVSGAADVSRSRTSSLFSFTAPDVVLDDIEDDDDKESLQIESAKTLPSIMTNKRMAIMNLTKNVVGSGMCSLPSALSQASVVMGLFLMTFVAFLSAASFIMIAYLCNKLGCRTYRDLWGRTFGASSSVVVDISLLLNSIIGCVACVVLVCDFSEKGIPGIMHTDTAPSRHVLVAVSTLMCLLPLAHVTNLAPLKYTSMAGLLITIYVICLVVYTFFNRAAADWPLKLEDNTISFDKGALFALSIYVSSFKAHYNAPIYYKELGDNVASHATVTASSYGISWAVYVFFSISGYGLFGNAVVGNVLQNFPDGQASVLWAWLGMAFVVIFTYPLVFNSGRQSLYGLIPALARARETNFTIVHICVTSGLVLTISLIGAALKDVSIVVGFMGATVGSALSFTIPAAVYLKQAVVPWSPSMFVLAVAMLTFGLIATFGGTSVVIMKAIANH